MALDSSLAITESDLTAAFAAGEKGGGVQLLGTESEKFGVQAGDPRWRPILDHEGGPIIALERGSGVATQQISLEPGAQLELSGAAVATVHDVARELDEHLAEIAPAAFIRSRPASSCRGCRRSATRSCASTSPRSARAAST
jgi:gamma-glutamylcysteine synthetase